MKRSLRREHQRLLPTSQKNITTDGGENSALGLQFTNTPDWALTADLSTESTGRPFTLEMWITPQSGTARKTDVVALDAESGRHVIRFAHENEFEWELFVFGHPVGIPRQAGRRVHFASVVSESGVACFLDGQEAGWTAVQNESVAYNSLLIGGPGYNGVIDEFRISRSARYTKEFIPEQHFTPDEHTVVLYHFDEGFGAVANDASGNGHSGTINAATWVKYDTTVEGAPVWKSVAEAGTATGFGVPELTAPTTALYFAERNAEVIVPTLFDRTDSLTIEVRLWRGRAESHSAIIDFNYLTRVGTGATNNLMFSSWHGLAITLPNSDYGLSKPVHLTGIRDGEQREVRLYTDGILAAKVKYKNNQFHEDGCLNICSNQRQWTDPDPNEDHSFSGWIDELRISGYARYTDNFEPPVRMAVDDQTLAIYHFEEGQGDQGQRILSRCAE
ncbi:MAG: hypothetical protein O2945_01655 [Planctomycetota bacterium]|nr:hypothetical protein [Planctomycetota bacterium]